MDNEDFDRLSKQTRGECVRIIWERVQRLDKIQIRLSRKQRETHKIDRAAIQDVRRVMSEVESLERLPSLSEDQIKTLHKGLEFVDGFLKIYLEAYRRHVVKSPGKPTPPVRDFKPKDTLQGKHWAEIKTHE